MNMKGLRFFSIGDLVMVHLKKEHYPKSTYDKINVKQIKVCIIKRKFGKNGYEVAFPREFENSSIFSGVDLSAQKVRS
jgi:hypothetical protein